MSGNEVQHELNRLAYGVTTPPFRDAQRAANDWAHTAAMSTAGVPTGGSFDFESGVAGWTATGGTIAQSTAFAHSGSNAAKITPTGGASASATSPAVAGVTAGNVYTVTAWAYAPNGWGSAGVGVNWYTAGLVFISSGTNFVAVPAGKWTFISVDYTAPGTAGNAVLVPTTNGLPAASDIVYWDEVKIRDKATFDASWKSANDLSIVGALNVAANNTGTAMRDLQGVCNQLAGTSGLGAPEALSRI